MEGAGMDSKEYALMCLENMKTYDSSILALYELVPYSLVTSTKSEDELIATLAAKVMAAADTIGIKLGDKEYFQFLAFVVYGIDMYRKVMELVGRTTSKEVQ
jgi:hypothetical protein